MLWCYLVLLTCLASSELSVRFVEKKSLTKSEAIDVRVEGGTPPYSFDWDFFSSPGIKKVTVTDATGNKGFGSSAVVDLGLHFEVKNLTCFGDGSGQIRVDVVGGMMPYFYEWSNGESTRFLRGVAAGEYCVTVKDSSVRRGRGCVTISEASVMVASVAVVDVSCFSKWDGIVDLSVSGGIPPYSFEWSGGGAKTEDIMCSKGVYRVVIGDSNGCEKILDNIVVKEPPKILADVVEIESTLEVVVVGGIPPYSFIWKNGETSKKITTFEEMNKVLVRDANNCTKELTIIAKTQFPKKWNELHEFASKGDLDNMKVLIDRKGFDVNSLSENGSTALLIAVENENVEMVKYLLSRGANVNIARLE